MPRAKRQPLAVKRRCFHTYITKELEANEGCYNPESLFLMRAKGTLEATCSHVQGFNLERFVCFLQVLNEE